MVILKKPLMVKIMDYIKANAFVFYSINSESFINFIEYSKTENSCEFLTKIVEQNQTERIIFFLYNSKSHHADKTVRRTRELKNTTGVSTSAFTRSKSCRIFMENN